jgi:hypothetical protein
MISETCTKLYKRYQEITDILKNYTHIKKVNNIELLSFDKTLDILQNKVSNYLESKLLVNSYNISIIHGDCQFNNILYNSTNDDFVFIDPRGYFGNLDLYGIPEYDFAKIKFALSGYDIFDGYRSNIAIRDISIRKIEYSESSEFYSTKRIFPRAVTKIGLIVDATVPPQWKQGDWITYYLSVDGNNWQKVTPLSSTNIENSLTLSTATDTVYYRFSIIKDSNDKTNTPKVNNIAIQAT